MLCPANILGVISPSTSHVRALKCPSLLVLREARPVGFSLSLMGSRIAVCGLPVISLRGHRVYDSNPTTKPTFCLSGLYGRASIQGNVCVVGHWVRLDWNLSFACCIVVFL